MNKSKHAKVVERSASRMKRIVFICIACVLVLLILAVGCLALLLNAGRSSLHEGGQTASYAQSIKIGNKTYSLNPNVSSILFMGVDKDNGRATPPHNGQVDALMLFALNEDTGKITCVALSRSSWTSVLERDFESGLISQRDSYLCLGYNYGYDDANSSELVCQDVSHLLNGLPVDSYYTLNMSGIGALADAVGGVRLTALSDVAKTDIKAGDQLELFGDSARDYVWQRDVADDYSSAERLQRQEQFAKAFAVKALEECKSNPLRVFELFNVAGEHSVTNLEFSGLAYLASFIASHQVSDIDIVALPGEYVPIPDQPTKFEIDEMQMIQMVVDLFYIEA